MSEYKFSSAQRYAVFATHGERCYLCTEPVDLKSMQVDHILPEKLLESPSALRRILREYGISAKFNINSYENWLPACGRCNLIKRAEEFTPSPMLQILLQRAARGASEARSKAAAVVKSREIAKILNTLERVDELGGPAKELLEDFIRAHRSGDDVSRPVLITPTAPLQFRLSPKYLRTEILNYPGETGFAARLDNLGRLTVCAVEGVDVEQISISSARWNPDLLEFEEREPLHADPVVSGRVYQLMARGVVESDASLDAKCVEIFGLLRAHGLPSVRHGNLPAYLDRFGGKVRHLLMNGMRAVFLGMAAEANQEFQAAAMELRKAESEQEEPATSRNTAKGGAKKAAKGGAKKAAKGGAKKAAKSGAKKAAKGGAKRAAKGGAKKAAKGGAKKAAKGGAKNTAKGGAKKTAKGGAKSRTL